MTQTSIWLNNLSTSLLDRCDAFDTFDDLDEAFKASSRAVDIDPDNPDRKLYLNNLATVLLAKFDYSGCQDYLKKAMSYLEETIDRDQRPPTDYLRLHTLANAYTTRYEKTGSLTDLNEAIKHRRATLRIGDHPKRPMYLHSLSHVLHTRGIRFRSDPDFEESERCISEAIRITDPDHPAQAKYWNAYASQVQRNGDDPERLEEAINAYKRALDLKNRTNKQDARIRSNLAIALSKRFKRTNKLDDLDGAIALVRTSVASDAPTPRAAVRYRFVLAQSLFDRFKATGEDANLDEAIIEYDKVAEDPLGDEYRTAYFLLRLSLALMARNGDRDRIRAGSACIKGARMEEANPTTRIVCAKFAAQALVEKDLEQGQSLFAKAVELLPDLVPHQVTHSSEKVQVSVLHGVASTAAALTLDCKMSTAKAVALLDAGRFIVLGQKLDIRSDVN